MTWYAQWLGANIGRDVDLHSAPPVTGLLKIGKGASVEPEVDLAGHWLDGDELHIGKIRIGAGARVGARSTLLPGARIGKGADDRARLGGQRRGAEVAALGRIPGACRSPPPKSDGDWPAGAGAPVASSGRGSTA